MGTYDNLVAKLEETAENLERMCCDELQIAIGAIRKRTPLPPVVKGDVCVYCPSCGRQIRSGREKLRRQKEPRPVLLLVRPGDKERRRKKGGNECII